MVEPEPRPEPEPEPELEDEGESESESVPEPELEGEGESESESASEPELEGEGESESESASDPDPEPESGSSLTEPSFLQERFFGDLVKSVVPKIIGGIGGGDSGQGFIPKVLDVGKNLIGGLLNRGSREIHE